MAATTNLLRGGGAVVLAKQPKRAVISDANEQLINVYRQVRDNPDQLIVCLEELSHRVSKEDYYQVRESYNNHISANVQNQHVAAEFIYLLQIGFNGLYRTNKRGLFNVAKGTKNNLTIDVNNIKEVSDYLNNNEVELLADNFSGVLGRAKEGDLVYFDPPYVPLTKTSSFIQYTSAGFTTSDQVALRDCMVDLTKRGVKVVLPNSSAPECYELYEGFDIQEVLVYRRNEGSVKSRGKVKELVVTNF